MLIKFLGTGSAFTLGDGNWHSNLLIEKNGRRLLLDCGSDIRFSLHEAGLSMTDIDEIYISHLHGDHVGGLEYAAFFTYFNPNKGRPVLHISKSMSDELWRSTLAGGLGSLEGKVMTMDDYFEVQPVEQNQGFWFEGTHFQLVQVIHIMNGFTVCPSFGLLWKENGQTVFWTSDSQYCPHQINKFYEMADVIFHDCETSSYKSGVHAHFTDLCKLNDVTRAKMWLYHYQPGVRPDAEGAGFAGFVVKGQEFNL